MKICIISDIHFDVRNGSRFFTAKYRRFFKEIFFPEIDKRGIKHLWILGDTWEYRTKLNVNSMVAAFDMFFTPLQERGIEVTIIYGNHDVAFRQHNDVNSIDFLGDMYPNVHVVKTHETKMFGSLPVSFISWINNTNLQDSLDFIANAPPTVICGHFEIKSFEMNKGHVCDHGFDKSIFNRYDRVFSGHFHQRSSDGKIHYLGNPFQTNWGDYGQQRGFHIFDTESLELEFVENTIDVYRKVAYSDSVDLMDIDFEEYRDRIVRIYIQSFAGTNQHKLGLYLEKMNQVAYSCDVVEIDETEITIDGEVETLDNTQLITNYINDVVSNDNVDKSVLLSMFMDIYSEAQNMVDME